MPVETASFPCPWAPIADPLYRAYHDTEWGVPEKDGRALWEKLVLDGFQAGLSWITILRKRDSLRRAFAGFDPEKVARFDDSDRARLLNDPGIIRSAGKIEAAIGGARIYLDMQSRGEDFSGFLWDFVDGEPIANAWTHFRDAPTDSPLSRTIATALKQRGFKYCGPVIVYAFMQAVGMVNDHEIDCPRHEFCRAAAR